MRRIVLAVGLIVVGLPGTWAQIAAPPAPQQQAEQPQLLSQTESVELLKSLNEQRRLIPRTYAAELSPRYKELKPDGCFGVRLAGGARLVGESSGKNEYGLFGFEFKDGKAVFSRFIGVLYSEFSFSIADTVWPAGAYAVDADQETLLFSTDTASGADYNPALSRNVPPPKTVKLPLPQPLPEALLKGEGGAIPTPALQAAILRALDNSLRRQKYQNNPNPVAGHCYVSSEALYYLLGGPQGEWMPQFIRHESEPHWFLRHRRTGAVLDLTASQFQTSVPYAKGRRQAFLTSGPSRRAQVVIARVRNALAVP